MQRNASTCSVLLDSVEQGLLHGQYEDGVKMSDRNCSKAVGETVAS